MIFNVFLITAATLALTQASPFRRQYSNETTSYFSSAAATTVIGWGPISSVSNSILTNTAGPVTTSSLLPITTTAIESTTLSYTLGTDDSSTVTTTVIENTSTIITTRTMYTTMTRSNEQSGQTVTITVGTMGDRAATAETTTTSEPNNYVTSNPVAGEGLAEAPEPTVTLISHLTTTETFTLEDVTTGANGAASSDSGAIPWPSAGYHPPPLTAGLPEGQGGVCSITTVTTTVIEQSTVTVTPASTDNFPIAPSATPSYGFGNGTYPTTGFPTASSGFLTLHKSSTVDTSGTP